MSKARYLPVNVFRDARLGDCTNGGVSSTHDQIYIRCPDGFVDEEEVPEHLRFQIERKDATYYAAVPVNAKPGMVGPMAGGNLAWTSDSRLHVVLHIHDRFDTKESYLAATQ